MTIVKSGLIDYGGGNLQSVRNALRALGHEPVLVRNSPDLTGLDAIIFPGQGAFGDCMTALRCQGLVDGLQGWIAEDRPFFGICIGYQVLFECGAENPGVKGLGVFQGEVVRFPSRPDLKVPHMGWNQANLVAGSPLEGTVWHGLGSDPSFYFVHSYFPQPADVSLVASRTDYADLAFASSVARGNLIATQFHPEKSQNTGLKMLANFLKQSKT